MALYKVVWKRDGRKVRRDFHNKPDAVEFAKLPREAPVTIERYREAT